MGPPSHTLYCTAIHNTSYCEEYGKTHKHTGRTLRVYNREQSTHERAPLNTRQRQLLTPHRTTSPLHLSPLPVRLCTGRSVVDPPPAPSPLLCVPLCGDTHQHTTLANNDILVMHLNTKTMSQLLYWINQGHQMKCNNSDASTQTHSNTTTQHATPLHNANLAQTCPAPPQWMWIRFHHTSPRPDCVCWRLIPRASSPEAFPPSVAMMITGVTKSCY